jgi:predicted transcriptional regulator
LTANDVRGELLRGGRNVARNTVRTLLERMEQKGWLTHVENGRTFLYSAAQPRSESIGHKVREVIDTICGGSPETLVTALLDFRGLRKDELKRIRELLDNAEAKRGGGAGAGGRKGGSP